MTTYAIGNVNSQCDLLLSLLDKIDFDKQRDCLWFTGNLINPEAREPLSVIRFIRKLGKAAITVLGDEDFKLIASVEGHTQSDSIEQLYSESDIQELLGWLRNLPLMHYDARLNFAIVHAGIPPEWSLSQARTFAFEVESALSSNHRAFLENINGKRVPRRWNAKLRGWKRLHFISQAFTRIQCCNENGYMDFASKVASSAQTDEYKPWYQQANRHMANVNIIFSHATEVDNQACANVFPINAVQTKGKSLSALKLMPIPETVTVCG